MSLEKLIEGLTEALNANTAAIKAAGGKPVTTASAKPTKAAEAETEGSEAAEPAKKPSPSTPKATSAPKAESAKAPAADAADPAYAPVKKAILDAIAGGHRTAVTALLKEYGAKTGQDLTPDVYDEVLGKIADITDGTGDLA